MKCMHGVRACGGPILVVVPHKNRKEWLISSVTSMQPSVRRNGRPRVFVVIKALDPTEDGNGPDVRIARPISTGFCPATSGS